MSRLSTYVILHLILLLYSVSALISKLASQHEFLSPAFILLYGCVVALLVIYAIFWQQILKRLPLSIAFANKGIVMIWGMMWGALIFGEIITANMIIGCIVVFFGIALVVSGHE